ncbi:MAG: glycosyltransferase [Dehalococcoidales bacterium]|nr:glycosyltransferase [Dehalococcoidales bacterium]
MRILITQETDWLRRNPAQQHHLAELMSLRGHEVRAIDYELLWRKNRNGKLFARRQVFENVAKIYSGARVTVVRPGMVRLPYLEYLSTALTHRGEIERQVQEFSPDVIIGFGIVNSLSALLAARRYGLPFIYYWIDVLHRLIPQKAFQPLGLMIEKAVLRRSDMVLVINEALKDLVVGIGADPARTRTVRAGIDDTIFNPAVADRNAIRRQYGIPLGDTVLFFMGWLYRFSGLKEVAQELARLHHTEVRLLVVGEGDLYGELEKIRNDLHLGERLILTGRKDYHEIPSLISAADICLLPAYPDEKIMQDIVPIKLYEYMAMGKPVIATRLPGVLREFGTDNGIVYVSRPKEVLTRALELVRGGALEDLGAKARKFAMRNRWQNVADEFENILKEVIAAGKKKSG